METMIYHGGFHERMPIVEAESLGFEIDKRIGKLSIGYIEDWKKLKRMGTSHFIFHFLGTSELDSELPFTPEKIIEGTFCARFKVIDDTSDRNQFKNKILEKLDPHISNVDLEEPETKIYFFLNEGKVYSGKLLHKFDPSVFNQRKPPERPFSPPVTLQPREARAWVNLSGIETGQKLLDPFCGSGCILIEAGLMGCDVYGSDIDVDMLEGCNENLAEYGVEGNLKEAGISSVDEKWDMKFDAIVTDPPYGISSSFSGGSLSEIYSESIKKIDLMLKDDGRAVIGCPDNVDFDKLLNGLDSELEVLYKFTHRVHKSLVRTTYVLQK